MLLRCSIAHQRWCSWGSAAIPSAIKGTIPFYAPLAESGIELILLPCRMQALVQALQTHPKLHTIDLRENRIGHHGGQSYFLLFCRMVCSASLSGGRACLWWRVGGWVGGASWLVSSSSSFFCDLDTLLCQFFVVVQYSPLMRDDDGASRPAQQQACFAGWRTRLQTTKL